MSVKSRRRQAFAVGPVTALAIVLAGCGGTGGGGDGADADANVFPQASGPGWCRSGPAVARDQVARSAAAAMEGVIDQQIPVVNVPGATGSTGMTKMLSGKAG